MQSENTVVKNIKGKLHKKQISTHSPRMAISVVFQTFLRGVESNFFHYGKHEVFEFEEKNMCFLLYNFAVSHFHWNFAKKALFGICYARQHIRKYSWIIFFYVCLCCFVVTTDCRQPGTLIYTRTLRSLMLQKQQQYYQM